MTDGWIAAALRRFVRTDPSPLPEEVTQPGSLDCLLGDDEVHRRQEQTARELQRACQSINEAHKL